jgi:MFS family permease
LLTEDYDETTNTAGEVSGNLNFYADLLLAIGEFAIGFLLDYFGRKTLSIIGFFVYGTCMMASPYAGNVYPGLLCVLLA